MTILAQAQRHAIRELLADLDRVVPITVETGPAETPVTVVSAAGEIDFNARTVELVETLGELAERVTVEVVARREPGRWPTVTVGDGLRYVGLPWGYELSTLVAAIREAARPEPSLGAPSLEALGRLERDLQLDVYVTPT